MDGVLLTACFYSPSVNLFASFGCRTRMEENSLSIYVHFYWPSSNSQLLLLSGTGFFHGSTDVGLNQLQQAPPPLRDEIRNGHRSSSLSLPIPQCTYKVTYNACHCGHLSME
ncbi:hypothetical protein TNCT_714241 [Trichonephila clavata]|uniref:Uncharacterized protein n=1 Tax=Trichonephila clavata TaxID=2740835 RepID=A0A8X6LHY6_TRICU|nr:hypothetical protein TNCT_714241 [Trichonephila clavata]